MLLEEGAVQAAQGKPEAAETFRKFIHDFPQSPRVSEAWVALAELAFHAPRPDLDAARKDLARAREESPTPAALERADYLEIWFEDAASSTDEDAGHRRGQQISPATSGFPFHRGSADEIGGGLFSPAGFRQRPDPI